MLIAVLFYTYGKQKKDTKFFSNFAFHEQIFCIPPKKVFFSKHLKYFIRANRTEKKLFFRLFQNVSGFGKATGRKVQREKKNEATFFENASPCFSEKPCTSSLFSQKALRFIFFT